MKFYALFVAFMVMVLSVRSVVIDEDIKNYCEGKIRQETFAKCIDQYGGYSPSEGKCKPLASTGGEEYFKCLATTYFDLSVCFNHCPNHPLKLSTENHFEQYKQYYVPRESTPTTNNGSGTDPITGATATQSIDLSADDESGSTMLNAFSLGAVLTMIAYWLF